MSSSPIQTNFDTIRAAKVVALAATGAFAATAWAIHFREVPKLVTSLTDSSKKAFLDSFVKMYSTYKPPQVSMLAIATVASAYVASKDRQWLPVTLLAALPGLYTVIFMEPSINKPLYTMQQNAQQIEEVDSKKLGKMMQQWKIRHLTRTVISTATIGVILLLKPFVSKLLCEGMSCEGMFPFVFLFSKSNESAGPLHLSMQM
ncbi:hypothetical protein SAMD00019534_103900 [Acytostelium subglobosum LB1]|uniref:hypothetical protein n=1 Tax=Acytostelium subglobosum LB1 TaxID=1410327 RepID=UPI0006447C98|nr:hypothetical protein SAMD00019534_103900 [Acytostelium subglobosum LB1]GAM27215.1 hypothetical protein SAMD00019534_103900 [Acytostelium subglobosum LB1]|eukprot:XP_012749682.1 hypothetical protein SAMD00019534_103900 [Acytostelium subglobosum LB1]